jgi:MFS family permease
MPIENVLLHGAYYGGIAVAAVLGAFVFPRRRENCLLYWMLMGSVVTAASLLINSEQLYLDAIVLIVAGMSVGLGLPSSLAYFADTTAVENRGTYGGITWSTVGFGILAFALALTSMDLPTTFLALAVWRMAGLLLFFTLTRPRGKLELPPSKPRYGVILRRRDVALYLLPWIMFSLINFTEAPILGKVFGESQQLIGIVEFAITGIFATVGGIMGDLVGRKRVVIAGFVILGIEYAVLSLFSSFTASWYIYTLFDGIAWGLFASVFFMTLWGDLAETNQKEKFYVLGGLPYLLAGFLPVLVKPFLGEIETATAFSIASFFLFVAVLPLIYAPETLPERKIKERELRDYVEKAKKTKDKYV